MKKQIVNRYSRTKDGKLIIEIAAGKVEDLFHNFDRYTPYFKKDLDQDLVDYLIDSVREIGKEEFVIQFRFSVPHDRKLESRVRESIQNYFLYLKDLQLRTLSKMRRTSLILFSIGVTILFLSVWFNQKADALDTVFTHVFVEGLTVAAWVSLWNALATFLINWAPHRRHIKRCERITGAQIIFHPSSHDRE